MARAILFVARVADRAELKDWRGQIVLGCELHHVNGVVDGWQGKARRVGCERWHRWHGAEERWAFVDEVYEVVRESVKTSKVRWNGWCLLWGYGTTLG